MGKERLAISERVKRIPPWPINTGASNKREPIDLNTKFEIKIGRWLIRIYRCGLLKGIDADIVTHSDDWGEDFPGAEYMRSVGKKAIRTKYYPHQSTTAIIAKCQGVK